MVANGFEAVPGLSSLPPTATWTRVSAVAIEARMATDRIVHLTIVRIPGMAMVVSS
jgi:hypothetical protein